MEKQDLETRNRLYREAVEQVLKENQYLDNYLYAEHIVKTFIGDERNFQKGRFLRVTRINKHIFNYCVDTIKFLNPALYNEYLEAVVKSDERRKAYYENNIIKIANGIKTGHFEDGSKFDLLDFYRFTPLLEAGFAFVPELIRFMDESDVIDEETKGIIIKFMEDNDITRIIFTTENNILKNKTITFIPRMKERTVHNIFRYMFANGLPRIENVFNIVLDRYLSGEIDFGDLSRMEEKSKKNKFRKYYDNPYKLSLDHKLS